MTNRLTPDLLLKAYAAGVFPMADARYDDRLVWFDPDPRGIIPLESFHVPRRLLRTVRKSLFDIRVDTAFRWVVEGCADTNLPGRDNTWISDQIVAGYEALHRSGHAHSVEAWQDGVLVGGVYGVRLGSAFFGESMFSRERDASKVALVHLVARLIVGGFSLLDVQFPNSHTRQFGAIEIPRVEYRERLARALTATARFRMPLTEAQIIERWQAQLKA